MTAKEKLRSIIREALQELSVNEVAPPGWEGTVKAMKKHSVGGHKKWDPKKKKDEGFDKVSSDVEPSKCSKCGEEYLDISDPSKNPHGLCPDCSNEVSGYERDNRQDFQGGLEEKMKKKKITNPYALAWWMKNQGYKSHKKS